MTLAWKKLAWKTLIAASALLPALPAASTSAAPLNPSHVPADATWVIHLDLDAMQESAYAKLAREEHPQLVQGIQQWLQDQYGIDPRDDMHGVTMFSDTYESHAGTAILMADFDAQKAQAKIKENEDVREMKWQGHTIYVCRLHKDQQSHAQAGDRVDRERSAPEPDLDAPKRSPDGEYSGETLAILLLDGKQAIFSSSAERCQAAARLLKGEGDSLAGKKSPLIDDVPEGTFAYGAAVNLKNIKRNDAVFPILQQHERVFYATGERGGRNFEYLALYAGTEKVAQQMKTALEGMTALVQVWAADSKALSQIASQVEIGIEGKVVKAQWEGETQTVIAAIGDVMERCQQWQAAMTKQ